VPEYQPESGLYFPSDMVFAGFVLITPGLIYQLFLYVAFKFGIGNMKKQRNEI
jgi:hypothetical protein